MLGTLMGPSGDSEFTLRHRDPQTVANSSWAVVRLTLIALACSVAGVHCSAAPPPDAAAPDGLLGELARSGIARTIAPRLSIPSEYRRCSLRTPSDGTVPQTECEADPAATAPIDRILDLAARASAQVRAVVDPAALHTVALIDLLWADGVGNSLQRSISYLQTASRLADRPAPVLADLAAAYLVRAERTQNPRDLLEAIEAAERALELEPGSEAARFNLALALDRLGLDGQATEAWRQFLMVDSVSGWAAEARDRSQALAEVREPPPSPGASVSEVAAYASRAPQEAQLLGWDRLLGEWGAAVISADDLRAERLLRVVEHLGEALERQGGDATLADAVRVIRARVEDRGATLALARAHQEYGRGRSAYLAGDHGAAGHHFAAVLARSHASPPLDQWARLFHAATLVYGGQPEQGERALSRVAAQADTMRHPALAARARSALGSTLLRGGRYEEALIQFRRAAGLYTRAGEREHLGAVQYLDSHAEYSLGNVAAGYRSMHRALMTLRPYRGSVWLHNLFYVAAEEAAADGLLRAAVRLQDEGVRVAERTGAPMYMAEARLARARLLSAAGDTSGAREDVRQGQAVVRRLEPGGARSWFEADLQLSRAATTTSTAPVRSAAALDSVVTFFSRARVPLRLLPALVARAKAQLARGDLEAATADLDRALALLDEQRAATTRAQLHVGLADAAREVFDRIVMLYLARGQAATALAYLERGRGSLAPAATARPGKAQRHLAAPPGQVAVAYAAIGDTMLIWTVADTRVELTRRLVSRAFLTRTIERARSSLELHTYDAARSDLETLYDWLVRPVRERLGPEGTPLLLIADGEIGGIPFAALYDSGRRRYLIEDHPLRFAGSLGEAGSRQREARMPAPRALLVADPAFDLQAWPGLARLGGAEAEVEAIAAEYQQPVVLAGTAAARSVLESALRRADIVHYAGHAVLDDERPDRSFLILAPEPEGSGSDRLTAAEIEAMDLRHLQLVVLSACQTLRSRGTRSGGFAGFAGALLAAGASGVVGSLWRVDDRLTHALMVEFHRAYRASGDAAAALRTAQIQLLQSGSPALQSPAAWAAFRYAGN